MNGEELLKIAVDWNGAPTISRTVATMQVIPTPLTRRGRRFHEVAFSAIRRLDAKYVRYLPWGPYPWLKTAALAPPTRAKTSWNFACIDPELVDFLEATKGKEPIVNFSGVPAWMFSRPTLPAYPDDPDQMDWAADGFAELIAASSPQLVDPAGEQLADYYARIVSWYTRGGFTDENGKYHHSGYEYELPWWGVLNEQDFVLGPEQYTVVYDAIVTAIRKVSPKTRFLGLELASTGMPGSSNPEFFEYFLNPKNHRPGIPLDMIAYHFYALGVKSQSIEHWQYTFFDQADNFLTQVRYIESIRKRLSPSTLVYLDELGSMLPESDPTETIPAAYWNLSGALFAYLYIELAKLGIDAVGEAGFLFYPGMTPSVTMLDWTTGKLNARFHVLQLIRANFEPGDKLVPTTLGGLLPSSHDVAAQAFEAAAGRKLLIVNKRARAVEIELNTSEELSRVDVVDGQDDRSAETASRIDIMPGKRYRLRPFAVAVATVR